MRSRFLMGGCDRSSVNHNMYCSAASSPQLLILPMVSVKVVAGYNSQAIAPRLPMNTTQMRRQIKRYVDQLSVERLRVAADFLAYLAERESNEATQELLEISGFVEAFEKAKQNVAAGKVTRVDQLRRKY